jgi:hypothetical protein|nr:MAG: hypothetical protein [Bacteriophage sp.]
MTMTFEHLGRTGTLWLMNKIKSVLATKVDKVEGKGLSTNDFTTALKTSYDSAVTDVAALKKQGGEPNKINTVSVNGTALTPDSNKKVDITVPTTATIKTQIEAYKYQTSAQVQTAITSALSGVTSIDLQVVTSLPATGKKGVIYLVAHTHTDTGDIYDEFVWVESKKSYEKIGNTDVDLSAYVKSVDITDISETDLATMWNS